MERKLSCPAVSQICTHHHSLASRMHPCAWQEGEGKRELAYLELDLLPVNRDHASAKLHTWTNRTG